MRTNQSSLDTYHSSFTFIFTNAIQAATEKVPGIADGVLFGISIISQNCIQNSSKHPRWRFLRKQSKVFQLRYA